MQNDIKNTLKALFPAITQINLIQEMAEQGTFVEVPAGFVLLKADQIVRDLPLVISGSIKVVKVDGEGNEMFLYYILPGESCAMTLTSCIKREPSSVKAIVESDLQVLTLPMSAIHEWTFKYPSWNTFMVDTYSKRFDEVLEVVDHIAFQNLDNRLLHYLTEKIKVVGSSTLQLSKTSVAKDLNSSREVISRLFKKMEEQGIIVTEGNSVRLIRS